MLVREARLRSGLSQSALAQRLEMPQSTVARWETGSMEPSFANVLRAVKACDLDLELALVPRDRELERQVDAYLAMSPGERLAQNVYMVDFVEGARRRMVAAARG